MSEFLISFEDASRMIQESISSLSKEQIPLTDSVNRILSDDILAPEDLPSFASSAMDGWAIEEKGFEALLRDGKAVLTQVGEIPAGSSNQYENIQPFECVRIFTGSIVPSWAKAVVKQEDCIAQGDRIEIRAEVKEMQYIRPMGKDVKCKELVLSKGSLITPPAIGLLSALGFTEIMVTRKPVLGLVITGSELSEGENLPIGKIRDSNGPALETLINVCGGKVFKRIMVGDSPNDLANALSELLGQVDMLCISGGVSVGDYDFVKDVLHEIGVRDVFWRVAQRPGKPLYFGFLKDLPVFGLPGNPASSLACFIAHVWLAIRCMLGATPKMLRSHARTKLPIEKQKGFTAMIRGKRLSGIYVEPTGSQDSNLLSPFVKADCLILCPPEYKVVPEGTEVEVIPFPWSIY